MVRIVIAGGTSSLASEVIDGLAATGRHEIILFSRQVQVRLTQEMQLVTQIHRTLKILLIMHIDHRTPLLRAFLLVSSGGRSIMKTLINSPKHW